MGKGREKRAVDEKCNYGNRIILSKMKNVRIRLIRLVRKI